MPSLNKYYIENAEIVINASLFNQVNTHKAFTSNKKFYLCSL